jgi:heat shock protein HslJ
MKRLYLLLSLVLLAALAACRQQEPPQPTAEPVVEAAPTEAPPTAEPTAEPAPPTETPAPAHEADPALIDTLWLWTARDAATPIEVPNPENYNIIFNEDGTFFAGLDCNRGGGSYATPGDGAISMELGMVTRAACPEDSLFNQMSEIFANAASYEVVEDGEVLLITSADGSTDSFRDADTFTAAPPALENADPELIDRVWQWEQREAGDETTAVPNPEAYTLTFNADGSFFAELDCNVGGGTYTTEGPGSLTMTLERTTLAFCVDDSLAEPMKTMFGPAITYAFEEDGALLVMTHEDGTVDTFRAATGQAPTLTSNVWQWLGTTTGEGPVYVADSTRYLIEFMDDGTAAITADCNNVIAEYTVDEDAISITPGPSTLAACPADSQGDLFVQQLSGAAIYFFQDGDLYIDLIADSGTMRFSPLPEVDLPAPDEGEATGTVNAPDGVFLRTGPGTNYPSVGAAPLGDSGTLIGISEDGLWYVVEAPSLPDGQVWVFAEFVDATNADDLPVVPTPPLPNSLVGRTWAWLETVTPEETIGANDPTRYTIDFQADGTAAIQADCNRVIAAYTTDGQSITITPGPTTLAACPEDSQADQFIQQLSNAAVYFFQGDELFIDQFASAGTMRFVSLAATSSGPADESTSEGTVTTGPTGQTFRVVSFGPAGAETPVIEGTQITALFDTDQQLVSGSSGCNTYTGSLNTATGAFAIGPLASTMMACSEPEGIMEQEAAFLAALGSATAFQWSADANTNTITGTINYTLSDGTNGVINLVAP